MEVVYFSNLITLNSKAKIRPLLFVSDTATMFLCFDLS